MVTMSLRQIRFSFGLKALFAIVTTTAVILGWSAAQLKWKQDRAEARRWIDTSTKFCIAGNCVTPPPPWPLGMLNEEPVAAIYYLYQDWQPDDDARYRQLKRLFPEAEFSSTSDDELSIIRNEKQMKPVEQAPSGIVLRPSTFQ